MSNKTTSIVAIAATFIALLALVLVMLVPAAPDPMVDVDLPAGASNFSDIELTGSMLYNTSGTDLYPLGNATNARIMEFGATGAISVTAVTPVAITTVTAYGCNVNSPTGAANKCGAAKSGGTVTFTVYNSAVTPVAVVTPHAAGASFWIAGN